MAKDLFHQAVKQALIKDGWTITNDPLTIRIDRVKLEIDLAAEKVFAAEKDEMKIAVALLGLRGKLYKQDTIIESMIRL